MPPNISAELEDGIAIVHLETTEKLPPTKKTDIDIYAIIGHFLHNVEALSWITFIVLSVLCALPAIVYIVYFTKMGYGVESFYYFSENYSNYFYPIRATLVTFFLIVYLLDFSYWPEKGWAGKLARYLAWGIITVLVIALAVINTERRPHAPICIVGMLTPVWLKMVKEIFFPGRDAKVFISWLSGPLFFVSTMTVLSFFLWVVVTGNYWNGLARAKDAAILGYEPDFSSLPDCENQGDTCFFLQDNTIFFPQGCETTCVKVYDSSLNTFMVWVGPLLISGLFFVMSVFCTFVRSKSADDEVLQFAKLWLFLLFCVWVTAVLIGAGDGIGPALMVLTITSFVSSSVFLMGSATLDKQREKFEGVWKSYEEKHQSLFNGAKGLITLLCGPMILMYFGLSFFNQMVRRVGLPCSKPIETEEERKKYMTAHTEDQINYIRSWEVVNIYTACFYWGFGFMVLQVFMAELTTLFLSWLIKNTQSMSLATVSMTMFLVGISMFLIPVIPGPPVYLACGIIVTGAGRSSLGLPIATIYCILLCLFIKLCACTIQMKGIGENLSKSIGIRHACQVNSDLMRTVKLILSQPGLSPPKVSILVGGPDWPTSVLCGILRLNLSNVLIGTVPVLVIIAPTSLTGSFTYMASLTTDNGELEFPKAVTGAATMTAITALSMICTLTTASYFLEKVSREHADELKLMPYDDEVKVLEDEAEKKNKAYETVTRWDSIPSLHQVIIRASALCMIVCCYTILLFDDDCFVQYDLTDTIEHKLGGDWTNLFLPPGRVALGFFMASCVFFCAFVVWATRKSNTLHESSLLTGNNLVKELEEIKEKTTSDNNDNNSASDSAAPSSARHSVV